MLEDGQAIEGPLNPSFEMLLKNIIEKAKRFLKSLLGMWGVTVKKVSMLDSLSIEGDPIASPFQDWSHSLINFSKLSSESRIKAAVKQLTVKACDRDCLYRSD